MNYIKENLIIKRLRGKHVYCIIVRTVIVIVHKGVKIKQSSSVRSNQRPQGTTSKRPTTSNVLTSCFFNNYICM